uniref:Ig-like domain-containing protein n=1 Tax=Lepisosteus oculatus TaxID=7918 RepID=W5MGJ9_LEPOC
GSVSLQCSFSTSSSGYGLYWYRQYPHTPLQFILFKEGGTWSGEHTEDFAKDRFSSAVDGSSTTLTITKLSLNDSAVYFCALRAAQCRKMENTLNVYLKNDSCQGGCGNVPARGCPSLIRQTEVFSEEGESVTLSCGYSTDKSAAILYWFRQKPHSGLEYIQYIGARGNRGANHAAYFARVRFGSSADTDSTTLRISDLSLDDTAVYYCA